MSEKNLEGLIATLKTEAIEAAEKQAGEILAKAREKAQAMLEEAAATEAEILQRADTEAKATLEKGKSALRQAERDLGVSVRNDLLALYKGVLEREVEGTFSPELIEKAVLKILENVGRGVALELPANSDIKLTNQIQKRLQDSGAEVLMNRNGSLANGFAISKEDEGWTYSVTPDEVTELLHAYLTPKWLEIFKTVSEK